MVGFCVASVSRMTHYNLKYARLLERDKIGCFRTEPEWVSARTTSSWLRVVTGTEHSGLTSKTESRSCFGSRVSWVIIIKVTHYFFNEINVHVIKNNVSNK